MDNNKRTIEDFQESMKTSSLFEEVVSEIYKNDNDFEEANKLQEANS